MRLSGDDPLNLRPGWAEPCGDVTPEAVAASWEPLPPARRLSLYLKIARRVRPYPHGRGVRRAAVKVAWEARAELRARDGQP